MEDGTSKNEITKALADVELEYHPSFLEKKDVDLTTYTKLPLTKISALGLAFEPLAASFQNVAQSAEGLYTYVSATPPSQLVQAKAGGALGAVARGNNQVGGGMARFTAVGSQSSANVLALNPAMLFMAAALMGIDRKLDVIQKTQTEMFEFLKVKEQTKLRGDLNFLNDILSSYKYNWENEKFKANSHIKVLDIKQEAEQNILFYREQIEQKLKDKFLFHSDKNAKDKLKQVHSDLDEHKLALYLYAFAAFLEVMLLENFASAYLDEVVQKLEDYAFRYRELYTQCYNQLEGYSDSSLQSYAVKGLRGLNKVAGNAAAKIPVVGKLQIDEALIETSGRLDAFSTKKREKTLDPLIDSQDSSIQPFVDNILVIDKLYNQPTNVVFDGDDLYLDLQDD